jgi:hypothetical protein
MNQQELESILSNQNRGGNRFFGSIGSTNDEALAWVKNGAGDHS